MKYFIFIICIHYTSINIPLTIIVTFFISPLIFYLCLRLTFDAKGGGGINLLYQIACLLLSCL